MKTTFIYALKELAPGEFQSSTIRYVGKANDPYKRFEEHLRCREKSHLGNWIRGLPATGGSLQLEVLDEVPDSQWQFWEREYIRVFRAIGFKLVNLTGGGEGFSDPSGAISEKISRSLCGKKQSSETVEKRCRATRGKKRSPEQRQTMSRWQLGKTLSAEHRAKIGRANSGRKYATNTSGFAGVHKYPGGRWQAGISKPGGGKVFLGAFDKLEDAVAARAEAMHKYYGS